MGFNGKRMRKLRQEKGYTQEDLAKLMNVTKGSISNYENGVSKPNDDMQVLIADLLETTTDYLLGRTDDHNPLPGEEYIKELLTKEKIKIILPDIDVDDLLKVPPEIRKKLIKHFNENIKMMLNYGENQNKN